MSEQVTKPFLTVETGEAYQPIRLSYTIFDKQQLVDILDHLQCLEKKPQVNAWNWFWRDECDNTAFSSEDSYKKNLEHPLRLGSLSFCDEELHINLTSFKRGCLAVPFFHQHIAASVAKIDHADFINKVFGLDERLPRGFGELFKEENLEEIVQKRFTEYEKIEAQCEAAATAEEAFQILAEYTQKETQKRLPYAERFVFQYEENQDADVLFLAFYIFLHGRELVAIRRWFGDAGYSLSDAAHETVEQVFGGMNIDILDTDGQNP